jgi:hypothetical protein
MMVRALAIATALGAGIGCGAEDEPPALWGDIYVVSRDEGTGGYAGASLYKGVATTGYRQPGTCATNGGAPALVDAGSLFLRIGELERQFGRNGYGNYLDFDFPQGTLEPGTSIRAEGLGTEQAPPFVITTAFPPRMENARIDGREFVWPIETAPHPLAEPLTATWTPGGGDHVGLIADDGFVAAGCSARDDEGSVTLGPELLQVYEPGTTLSLSLRRCTNDTPDVDGVREVLLTACHLPGYQRVMLE